MKIRKSIKNQIQQNAEAVERERERERERVSLLSKEKVWPIILIILISGVILFASNNKDLIKNSIHLLKQGRTMLGENNENNLENTSNETVGATAVDTSKWDMTRVNAVADTEGVYVPVPKGFVASGATGEHTVKTGFVIYEGDEPVDDTNAWDESCTRNQFVWVPVPDTTRVFEDIGTTGMKKAKLWNFNSTGRTALTNNNTDTRREPGILTSHNDDKQKFSRNGMQGYTKENLYQELSTSFDRDMESIEKYGGFYIGRFETRKYSDRASSSAKNEYRHTYSNLVCNVSKNEEYKYK